MSDEQNNDNQETVRIRKDLKSSIHNWLKTDYARSLGFSSMSNFMTHAGREMLLKYRVPMFTDVIRYKTHYELYDNIINKKLNVVISKRERALSCLHCKSFDCDHILHIWKIPAEILHLEQLNYLNPFFNLFAK